MKNLIPLPNIRTFSIILALINLVSVQGQRSPIISWISSNETKGIGETVRFVCEVHNAEDYPVLWSKTKPISVPISKNTENFIKDERFQTKFDPSTSSYILEIKDLQEIDDGMYSCRILITTESVLEADVGLRILRSPLIDDSSSLSEVAFEGRKVKLECSAHGYPDPVIWWRRPDNKVLPTGKSVYKGNTLEFPAVRLEDSGTYYCYASNRFSKSVRRRISLEVRRLEALVECRSKSICDVETR